MKLRILKKQTKRPMVIWPSHVTYYSCNQHPPSHTILRSCSGHSKLREDNIFGNHPPQQHPHGYPMVSLSCSHSCIFRAHFSPMEDEHPPCHDRAFSIFMVSLLFFLFNQLIHVRVCATTSEQTPKREEEKGWQERKRKGACRCAKQDLALIICRQPRPSAQPNPKPNANPNPNFDLDPT